jgi:purine-nucleoside phosphorylase
MARSGLWKRLETSAKAIQEHLGRETLPDTLVVLGSGFKGFEKTLENSKSVELSEIAHMPVPTVEGHGSALVVGTVGGREVAVMSGRVHMYEGHSAADTVYPLRTMSTLGVQRVLLTNAAGSVDPKIEPGTVMLVNDQINMTGRNCLEGTEAAELGQTFVDMSEVYDPDWRAAIKKAAKGIDVRMVEGVYVGLLGPTYETPAETRMLKVLGANVVGMSTIQEAIAARHLKLKVACLSFVTNMAGGLGGKLDHKDVLDLAAKHRQGLHQLLSIASGV